MDTERPTIIAIDCDDYHAEYVGRTADGNQFFLTTPFEPADSDGGGCEYVALYTFDPKGNLIDAKIETFGPRSTMDDNARKAAVERMLNNLGDFGLCRIEVAPFAVERFNTQFGLIIRDPEDDDDICAVEVQPGNYMAFYEPWDSGDYDT